MTILHYISFIIKSLLFLILSPLILLWMVLKFCLYKATLKKHLIKSGIPKNQAKYLVNDIKITDFVSFIKEKA